MRIIIKDNINMPTYRFPINGIRHHDFSGRLDELYEFAPGKRMSIAVEHDNPQEPDAVIVYWGKKWVGYVRSGEYRELAYSLIKASGRGSLLGKIVGVDKEKRWLWMEISTECRVTSTSEDKPNVLTNWSFDGEILPTDEEEQQLHTMLCNLLMVVEAREQWEEDTEEWLEFVEQNLWRDISCETSEQVKHLLEMLTAGSNEVEEYARAADRLQIAIDYMGSPEVRRLQAKQIMDKASSKAMELLLLRYGQNVKDVIRKLPQELVSLFEKDGEVFMGRLWYLHRPYKQIQALKTLLSMMVRLKDDNGEKASAAISKNWLIQWGSNQKDKRKAEIVHEILSTYELESMNPEMAQKMAEMMDCCNTQKQAESNNARIAEAIEKQKPPFINQMNMGNGTQCLPPDYQKALEDSDE